MHVFQLHDDEKVPQTRTKLQSESTIDIWVIHEVLHSPLNLPIFALFVLTGQSIGRMQDLQAHIDVVENTRRRVRTQIVSSPNASRFVSVSVSYSWNSGRWMIDCGRKLTDDRTNNSRGGVWVWEKLTSLDKHVVLWQGRLQVWEMLKTMSKFVVDGATWHRILELIVRIFF